MAKASASPIQDPSAKTPRDTREIVRIVGAGIALVLLVAFVLDNSKTVEVGFVFFHTKLS